MECDLEIQTYSNDHEKVIQKTETKEWHSVDDHNWN